MKNIFTLALLLVSTVTVADIDTDLEKLIKDNNLRPLEAPKQSPREVLILGSSLFRELELSGNRNITCMFCHHPRLGTSDGLPVSIGEGGRGVGPGRVQLDGEIIKRNSPALINLGYKDEITDMFHDGRVSYDPETKTYQTPEAALNGKDPRAKEITDALDGALSAQAIFPILSSEEMRGMPNRASRNNELAKLTDNLEVWSKVMDRLLKGRDSKRYLQMFNAAFPDTKNYNIGHVGNALGAFMKDNFTLVDTPYDSYLKGNLDALSINQKKGLKVFLTRGKCVNCHAGKHLSNFEYKSVGTPEIGPAGTNHLIDEGRFAVTGEKRDLYKFRTPPLRNIILTAPYMHNGAFSTLEEVVEHYDNVKKSMNEYSISDEIQKFYNDQFVVDTDPLRNKLRFNLISIGELRKGLKLTDIEKANLLEFLEVGLTDYRLLRNNLSAEL